MCARGSLTRSFEPSRRRRRRRLPVCSAPHSVEHSANTAGFIRRARLVALEVETGEVSVFFQREEKVRKILFG